MSVITMIKCEMCPEHFLIPSFDARPYEYETPKGWITLIEGNPQRHTGQHFCSKTCLAKWTDVEPKQNNPTKMRRFFLVNGDTADVSEGVKWSNGWVTCETEKTATFSSWERFKQHHDG